MAQATGNIRLSQIVASGGLSIFVIIMTLLLLSGCDSLVSSIAELPEDPPVDNPIDPDPQNPGFVPPSTTILTPSEGSTHNSAHVTVTWEGNSGVVAYQTWMEYGGWSAWFVGTSRTFGPLDEGYHSVKVRAAYDTTDTTLIEDTPETIGFNVDAVQGPSLRFSPPYREYSQNEDIEIDLVAEDVTNLMMVKAVFTFDPDVITLDDWDELGILAGNGGSILAYYDVDNVSGRCEINLSVVDGSPPGVTGTGTIVNLTFSGTATGLSSLTWVDAETEMRDPTNQPITIQNLVDGQVKVR